jgi:hypothetical protein
MRLRELAGGAGSLGWVVEILEQLTRVHRKLSGLLPAKSHLYVRGHRHACLTTGNLALFRQMGTESHQ